MVILSPAKFYSLLAGTALLGGGVGVVVSPWLLPERHSGVALLASSDKAGDTIEPDQVVAKPKRKKAFGSSTRPRVTERWLVGRWTEAPGDPCTDPGGIAYHKDGTFGEDEGGGRYRIRSKTIVFDNFYSWGDTDQERVPDPGPPNIQPIRAINANTVIIGTSRYTRCRK